MNAVTEPTQSRGDALSRLKTLLTFFRYNANNVFVGKFIYFILLAVTVFLTVIVIYTLDTSVPPDAENVFYFLIVPGILLVFYPSAYGIDTDMSTRMIETLFGIPDYRYKIWLARNFTQYIVIAVLLSLLTVFCRLAIADFSVSAMLFHILFPIVFIGSLSFMMSTVTRNGNGTAAVMVVIILFFFIVSEPLEGSRWDLFHNPFAKVEAFQAIIQQETTFYNRMYISIGVILSQMFGLLRMQKREKFV